MAARALRRARAVLPIFVTTGAGRRPRTPARGSLKDWTKAAVRRRGLRHVLRAGERRRSGDEEGGGCGDERRHVPDPHALPSVLPSHVVDQCSAPREACRLRCVWMLKTRSG